jgi:hypothetical protein
MTSVVHVQAPEILLHLRRGGLQLAVTGADVVAMLEPCKDTLGLSHIASAATKVLRQVKDRCRVIAALSPLDICYFFSTRNSTRSQFVVTALKGLLSSPVTTQYLTPCHSSAPANTTVTGKAVPLLSRRQQQPPLPPRIVTQALKQDHTGPLCSPK